MELDLFSVYFFFKLILQYNILFKLNLDINFFIIKVLTTQYYYNFKVVQLFYYLSIIFYQATLLEVNVYQVLATYNDFKED